jgi:2-polyprenyl-3-methyl-5-hydroxy-6-metoxy-1,4-benzoquinol methylase
MIGSIFPDMRERCFEKELMDDPQADIKKLLKTIRQFRLLNILFTSSRRLLKENFFSVMSGDPLREYTLLDIGSGGCDIDAWIVREARRQGISISVTALDLDRRILPICEASVLSYPEIKILNGSALELNERDEFDFIFSNHFLHHLEWEDIGRVISYASKAARLAFLFNDIERSSWAFICYTIFTGLFVHGSFAFYDGRLSIRRGFLAGELKNFIGRTFSQNNGITVYRAFPSRIVIKGTRG